MAGTQLVAEVRMKGAETQNVNPWLTLRNIIYSDRWKEDYPRIAKYLRLQKNQQRKYLHEKHRQEKTACHHFSRIYIIA